MDSTQASLPPVLGGVNGIAVNPATQRPDGVGNESVDITATALLAPGLALVLSEKDRSITAVFTPGCVRSTVSSAQPSAVATTEEQVPASTPPVLSAAQAPPVLPAPGITPSAQREDAGPSSPEPTVQPDVLHSPPTDDQVRELLQASGWQAWWVDEPSLGRWLVAAGKAKDPISAVVAQQRDGRCAVKLARDRMSATLTLDPPQGGQPVSLDQVRDALKAAGVTTGVLEPALADAMAAGKASDVDIALGRKPVNGENTQFDLLVANLGERRPQLNTFGLIDYRDLGDLVVVREGTPLMRRIPHTTGEPGVDVCGNKLPAKPGVAKPFAPGLKGAVIDPVDPDLLVAEVTGQPVPVAQGVKVDSNIVIAQVDMSTGNVKFDGAVNIKGDVKEGMRVVSTGDVYIGGTVEAAEIQAGGNVVIKGGVIGRNEYNGRASGREAWFNAKVSAAGSITARYAENAFLEAGVDVQIEDYAMRSEISALQHVVVGAPGAGKGRCMGGHVRATLSIRVAESGSAAGMQTVLQVGYNPLVTEQMEAIQLRMDKHVADMANLQKIIDFVQLHPERDRDGLLARASITQELHQGQLMELEENRQALTAALTLSNDAQVAVDVRIHGGTEIRLGSKVWTTAEVAGSGVFRMNEEGDLALGA